MLFAFKNDPQPFSVSWTLHCPQSTGNMPLFTLTIKSFFLEHTTHSRPVISLIKEADITLKLEQCVLFMNDRFSWSRSPSGLTWSHQFLHWCYTRLEDTKKTNWTTVIHLFLQCTPPVCPKFCSHRLPVDNDTAQIVGKTALTIKRWRADSFADLTGENYLLPIIDLT